MAKAYLLSESDRNDIDELLKWRKSFKLEAMSRHVVDPLPQAPEVYIARTRTGGIPPLEDAPGTGSGSVGDPDTVGSAECDVYQIVDIDDVPTLEPVDGLTRTVYNLSLNRVKEYQWILITRDKFGRWLVTELGECCAGSASTDPCEGGSGEVVWTCGKDSNGGWPVDPNCPLRTTWTSPPCETLIRVEAGGMGDNGVQDGEDPLPGGCGGDYVSGRFRLAASTTCNVYIDDPENPGDVGCSGFDAIDVDGWFVDVAAGSGGSTDVTNVTVNIDRGEGDPIIHYGGGNDGGQGGGGSAWPHQDGLPNNGSIGGDGLGPGGNGGGGGNGINPGGGGGGRGPFDLGSLPGAGGFGWVRISWGANALVPFNGSVPPPGGSPSVPPTPSPTTTMGNNVWCNATVAAGTVTLQSGYHVASITDNGAGDYTVNFSITFSSAEDFTWAGSCTLDTDSAAAYLYESARTTSSVRVKASTGKDVARWGIQVVGGATPGSVPPGSPPSGNPTGSPPTVTLDTDDMAYDTPTLAVVGTGFDPIAANNSITLSSGTATFTVASSTSMTLTWVTPPVNGSLTLIVTNSNGTSAPAVQIATVTGNIATGLAMRWPLDEGSGNTANAVDISGAAADVWDLTASIGNWSGGGYATFLTSNNRYLLYPRMSLVGVPIGNAPRSVSFWFKRGSGSSVPFQYGTVGLSGATYVIQLNDIFGRLTLGPPDGSVYSTTLPTVSTWTYVVITWSGTGTGNVNTAQYYLDGVLIDTFTSLPPLTTGTPGEVLIGEASDGTLLIDVRLYNGVISQAIIDAIFGAGVPPPGGAYLVYDTFTDTNGTAITSHTPDVGSSSWTSNNANYQIQSNKLVNTDIDLANGFKPAVIDSGAADVEVSVDLCNALATATPPYNFGQLVFRYVDDNNMWLTEVADGTLYLATINGGAFNVEDSVSLSLSDGVTYNYRVVANGTSVEVYIDDVLRLSATSSAHQTATKHGVMVFGSPAGPTGAQLAGTTFEDFTVIDA